MASGTSYVAGKKCQYFNCNNNRRNTDCRLFRFPDKDVNLCRKWVLNCGNPRNKVALQPGHSLMDWIRLGASGKDLTGVGPKAGTLAVTRQELAKHHTRPDAWITIRGRVYNITHYFPFHPGGEDELMKGAGTDATGLFEQVHPWVNYEQILQKCLIGRLVAVDPSIDTETLLFGEKREPFANSPSNNTVEVSPANPTVPVETTTDNPPPTSTTAQPPPLPRFDWIQRLDYMTVIFYTKPFSNPLLEIGPPIEDQTVHISMTYENSVFKNELVFFEKVRWPCDINVAVETGKIELVFRKDATGIWDNYGVLRQQSFPSNSISQQQIKSEYILTEKMEINYNTTLLKFERKDGRKIVFPVGKHLRVFGTFHDDGEISRSYTPVPESVFDNFVPHSPTKGNICLMVKRYPKGKMSCFITEKNLLEEIQFSKPLGHFELKSMEKRDLFLLLAAGSGITPILGIIKFLLERRIRKCQFLHLFFYNRHERDILLRNKLENLAKMNKRFKVDNILSEATDSWEGLRGHVNADVIENAVREHIKDTGYTIEDIFCFVCGPPKFNDAATVELQKIEITRNQVWIFEG